MTAIGIIIIAAAVLTAAAVVVWDRWRTRRLLKRLDDMLEKAITQGFTEEDYDESLLSAVETKLARYLASSTVSARNLQAEKDKIKTLIADISHQTKTPLANVLLYAQLLSEQPLQDESRACVTALEGQAEKLQSLIEALVKTSRLESGVLALHPQPASLAPMLEEAVAQFALKAAEKGIDLTLAAAEGGGVFDPKWTAEAVCNLLDNAVKYTPAGGSVAVQAHCYELFCHIDVTDTGPGIPEEEQAKVFQRFYRSPVNHQAQGVGIGLYLARQIAEGQGGYIKVFSKPGKGAKFSLYLPRN
nr:HAMP domain-containing sensor histidine kinase [uncultured Oscillibacter sp.]